MASDERPRTAFVLGGGGRWGAVEVGMLHALVDARIEADLIVGTSWPRSETSGAEFPWTRT